MAIVVITLLIVVLIGKACKVSTKGTIGLALLGTILEIFLGMLGVALLQVLVIPVLIFIIVRVARSIEQTNSDKEERSEKNKMIDDYIKEITDNNHNAEK